MSDNLYQMMRLLIALLPSKILGNRINHTYDENNSDLRLKLLILLEQISLSSIIKVDKKEPRKLLTRLLISLNKFLFYFLRNKTSKLKKLSTSYRAIFNTAKSTGTICSGWKL